MRISDSDTIEDLLCAGGDANDVSLGHVASDMRAACEVIDVTYRDIPAGQMRWGDRCAEAAYRLIESSPALRREWFGR